MEHRSSCFDKLSMSGWVNTGFHVEIYPVEGSPRRGPHDKPGRLVEGRRASLSVSGPDRGVYTIGSV